jgi:hypothetical protein
VTGDLGIIDDLTITGRDGCRWAGQLLFDQMSTYPSLTLNLSVFPSSGRHRHGQNGVKFSMSTTFRLDQLSV